MTTLALVGPDGAGKTTVAQRLADDPDLAVTYIYLGVNADASNHMLPTTRIARRLRRTQGRDTSSEHGPPKAIDEMFAEQWPSSFAREAKSTLRVLNQIADEWYRQGVAWIQQRRGNVVVFDRHYLADYAGHDLSLTASLPFHRRLHGFALRHLYPSPGAIVMLDAPAEVLLARKHEGTLDDLERRRQDYLALRATTERFHVVDATQALDDVVDAVRGIIVELAGS